MEDEFAWGTLEKEFAATDHAIKDPELVKMNEACEMAELKIKGSRITDTDTLIGECKALDAGVVHLIRETVGVTGRIQISSDNDEEGFFDVDNLNMQFNGFIYSVRDGQVEMDYQLYATIGEDGEMLDLKQIKVGEEYQVVVVQARRSEVDFDFDINHPVQAAAWLDLMDENLVKRLDSYLLPNIVDGKKLETIDDPYSLISLNTIGQLEIDLSHLEDSERAYDKTLQAINIYAEGCMSHDRIAPHRIDIIGDCLISSSGNYTPATLDEQDRLVVISDVVLQKRESDEGKFTFGFHGILLGNEPDELPLGIITQFKNTRNIRSVR